MSGDGWDIANNNVDVYRLLEDNQGTTCFEKLSYNSSIVDKVWQFSTTYPAKAHYVCLKCNNWGTDEYQNGQNFKLEIKQDTWFEGATSINANQLYNIDNFIENEVRMYKFTSELTGSYFVSGFREGVSVQIFDNEETEIKSGLLNTGVLFNVNVGNEYYIKLRNNNDSYMMSAFIVEPSLGDVTDDSCYLNNATAVNGYLDVNMAKQGWFTFDANANGYQGLMAVRATSMNNHIRILLYSATKDCNFEMLKQNSEYMSDYERRDSYTYYFRLTYENWGTETYDTNATAAQVCVVMAHDRFAAAQEVEVDTLIPKVLYYGARYYYKFSIEEAGSWQVRQRNYEPNGMAYSLYDAECNHLADLYGGQIGQINAGTYYLEIRSTADYHINIPFIITRNFDTAWGPGSGSTHRVNGIIWFHFDAASYSNGCSISPDFLEQLLNSGASVAIYNEKSELVAQNQACNGYIFDASKSSDYYIRIETSSETDVAFQVKYD